MNKVVFLNADGSHTAYFYDHPVKYVDDTGKIKDITLNIAESNVAGQFETAANSSVTTFSRNVTDGIGLRSDNTAISLVPHLPAAATKTMTATKATNSAVAKQIDSKRIAYTYDDKTTLEYSLTYTGFKEDIVVSEYTGQTRYDFTLYTNGLKLTERNGSFYLVDTAGAVKAQLGDIIIFTADDRNNTMGDMVAKTVVENQEYLLTILVDPEFLADEKTAYPIRIDPTIDISHENNGDGAIEDVTINSNDGSDGTAYSLSVGLREGYGISRTLMKFPILDFDLLGMDVVITDAKVSLRDLMCEETPLEVYCYVFSGNEWTESTANWSNVSPNSISDYLSAKTISYANGTQQPNWQTYSFDITDALEGWRSGTCNPDKGIIFKASSSVENGTTYNYKTLASYNRSSYRPTLSVTYMTEANMFMADSYYLNNLHFGDYLRYASWLPTVESGLISTFGNSIHWEIQNVNNGYLIRSKATPAKYLSVPGDPSSDEVLFATINDIVPPAECVWQATLSASGGYILQSSYNSRYLYCDEDGIYTSADLGAVGSVAYKTRVWRIVSQLTMSGRELSGDTEFFKCDLMMGYSNPIQYRPDSSNAIWANHEDFSYSGYDSSIISVGTDGMVVPNAVGETTILCTHKVTGHTFDAEVRVWPKSTDLGDLSCWASVESYFVGRWYTSPTTYMEKIDPNPTFCFSEGCATAISEWSNALGITMTETSQELGADIRVYGGTEQDLREKGEILGSHAQGLTKRTNYYDGYYLYNGSARLAAKITSANVYIKSVDNSTTDEYLTADEYIHVCVHEFGHALGFFGHASSTSAVMHPYEYNGYQLQALEKNHLKQVYDLIP